MSTRKDMESTIRAVRCHRFACVEKKNDPDEENGRKGPSRSTYQRRSPKALRLKDCLSLDRIAFIESTNPSETRNDTRVLIRTEYAGIQYPDALQALGLYQVKPELPYVPGMDVVGVVLKIIPSPSRSNSNVAARIQPGDRVLATMMDFGGTGGLSEIVLAPLKHVYKLPKLSPSRCPVQSAAGFANVGRNYFAAYHALVEVGGIRLNTAYHPNTNHDKIILVTGASGGVGMATIELAKSMGCTVIAGVGSNSKREGPISVGADAVLCYGRSKAERKQFRKQVLEVSKTMAMTRKANKGVDLIVDVVMGNLFEEALVGCLKPLGTIALVGFAAGQKPIRPGILLVKEVRVAGSIWGSIALEATEERSDNKYQTMVETILGFFATGAIKGRVDRIVPLNRFIEAFEVFEVNKGRGNTVISFVDHHDDSRAESNNARSRL